MYRRTGWACSKDFFNGTEARNYFASYHAKMKTEVENMTDGEIVACSFQEWASYLADKYSITQITLFESNI